MDQRLARRNGGNQSYGVTPSLEHIRSREFYEKGTKIGLFMNPRDPDYAALHECLYAFFEAEQTWSGTQPILDIFEYVKILKREWEVLKKDALRAAGFKDKVYGLLYRKAILDRPTHRVKGDQPFRRRSDEGVPGMSLTFRYDHALGFASCLHRSIRAVPQRAESQAGSAAAVLIRLR